MLPVLCYMLLLNVQLKQYWRKKELDTWHRGGLRHFPVEETGPARPGPATSANEWDEVHRRSTCHLMSCLVSWASIGLDNLHCHQLWVPLPRGRGGRTSTVRDLHVRQRPRTIAAAKLADYQMKHEVDNSEGHISTDRLLKECCYKHWRELK